MDEEFPSRCQAKLIVILKAHEREGCLKYRQINKTEIFIEDSPNNCLLQQSEQQHRSSRKQNNLLLFRRTNICSFVL